MICDSKTKQCVYNPEYVSWKQMEKYRDKTQNTSEVSFRCQFFDGGACVCPERAQDEAKKHAPAEPLPEQISVLASIPFLKEVIERMFDTNIEANNGFLYVRGDAFHEWIQQSDKRDAGLDGLKADVYPCPTAKRSSRVLFELTGGALK